jgi:hypothetical protein
MREDDIPVPRLSGRHPDLATPPSKDPVHGFEANDQTISVKAQNPG